MKKKRQLTIADIPEHAPALSEETQAMALYLAMAVRNAMEAFHGKHLSDEQMKELNPIIRDAIATALYTHQHQGENPLAKGFVNFQCRLIPAYWERPKLNTEFSRADFLARLARELRHTNAQMTEQEVIEMAENMLNHDLY